MNKLDINRILIYPESTIRETMKVISNGQVGVAILVEKHTQLFIRTIVDGDIRRALLDGFGLESGIDVLCELDSIYVDEDTPLTEAMSLFSDKIRIIPVVNKHKQVVDLYFHDKRNHIAVAKPFFDDEEIELVNECMVSGWVSSGGNFVRQFEKMFAEYSGCNYAISCNSGTAALHLILLAYGIGMGDEVIVPTLSFIATANAVSYTGATPVFVDSDVETWNIDPDKIENAITEKTKAIMPVHLYGHPADMDPINRLAEKYSLKVIEDAAEAQGAYYKNKIVGSLSDAAAFSFFGNKIITTGEGGMVVTNDPKIANRCVLFRDHGMTVDKRYWHEVIGYNYRMTNIQAAIGVAQMNKINKIVEKKKSIALEYEKHLKNVNGITLPPNKEWADNIYWLYTVLVDESKTGFNVSSLISEFMKHDIDSRIVFYPIHTQPIYKHNMQLPVAESIHASGISLPSAPDISNDEIREVCTIIKTYRPHDLTDSVIQ